MKICLIIVNYNGMSFLPKYLDNIFDQCNKSGIKLFVTDDNSTDDSVLFLKDNKISYTQNLGPNHGFAANLNNGILHAKSFEKFDYYIISNNDIEISNDFFPTLIKTLDYIEINFTNCGLIGFREMNLDKITLFKNYNFNNYNYNEISLSNEIPGFFFLISNNLINSIGLFNEDYFMYGEDNDYFHRAKINGYRILNTNIPIMHYSEGSSNDSKKTSWYVYRNSFLFAQLHLNLFSTIKLLASFINIIYNPFYIITSPSAHRIKRHGFIYNNYLLINSFFWNFKYYLKQKFKHE